MRNEAGTAPHVRTALPQEGRLRPKISRDTAFFWEGLDQSELRIQRCSDCGELRHPPGPMCPLCHSLEWDHILSSGHGSIYSFTVPYRPFVPGFTEPTTVVLVELDEGVRILSNLDAPHHLVTIGASVEVFYLPQAEGFTVHQFRIVRE